MGASGVDPLPWSWRECTLLNVCEAYEFCLTLRAPRSEVSRATLRRQGRVDFYVSVRDAHKSPSLPPNAQRRVVMGSCQIGVLIRRIASTPSTRTRRTSQITMVVKEIVGWSHSSEFRFPIAFDPSRLDNNKEKVQLLLRQVLGVGIVGNLVETAL